MVKTIGSALIRIALVIGLFSLLALTSCAKVNIKVPKPVYPKMNNITVDKGCICDKELRKVIDNMKALQFHIDELSTCPAWEE